MKISVIHNLYKRNPHVNESIRYNIHALEEINADYQYILFNDKGDQEIYDDVKDLLSDKVEYYYSEYNFGMGICSGGWVGALPLVKGDIIHNTGQDDVFIDKFYKKALEVFTNPEIMFFSCNGIKTDENLNQQGFMIHPQFKPDYSAPLDRFKEWCSHKSHWVVPVLNDTPIRLYDALITGGIPIVPRSLKYHRGIENLHDHVLFYDYEDIQNPLPITERANNLFDKRGIQGILDRHQLVYYNYHVDNRVETILKAVQDEFCIPNLV